MFIFSGYCAESHLPASQLEGWGYNGQNPVSMLITQKLKCLLILLDVIRLQFIDYKSRLQLFFYCAKIRTRKILAHYFPSETHHGGRLDMPRKSQMRLHNTARINGVMLARKLCIKFILTVLNVSRGLSLSTKKTMQLYANHILS